VKYDPDRLQEIAAQRERTIREAVQRADQVITDRAGSDTEVLNKLTAELARTLIVRTSRVIHSSGDPRHSMFARDAIAAADEVVKIHPEQDPEVVNWLWSEIARQFVDKLCHIFNRPLLIHDQQREAQEP